MEKTRKKVFLLVTKSNWGGAQKYVCDLALNLPKDKYEAVVIFGGRGMLADNLRQKGVRTVSIDKLGRDVSLFADISCFFSLLSLFKKEKPDIVHVNSSKMGGIGSLAARLAGVPRIVFTCHGWPFNEDRSVLSLVLIKLLSWMTVFFSHATIVVSERDLHDGQAMPWVKNKIRLVHNGIKEPKFLEKDAAGRELSELVSKKGVILSENDFLIGAIGELHGNKAYEYALEAIHELKHRKIPAKLVIFGEGEERNRLETLIKKLGLEKEAALLGFVDNAPGYLPVFDTFILSSIKEGLPYVVMEAGFAGLPVVTTNVGGVKEIVEDMKSGILVQTRKPVDMAQGLELIYNDQEKALIFGRNLKEKVSREFSLSKMTEKTLSVYEEA